MLMWVPVIAVRVVVLLISSGFAGARRLWARARGRRIGAYVLASLGCCWALPARAESIDAPSAAQAAPEAQCHPELAPGETRPRVLDVAALFEEFQCWLGVGQYAAALTALDQACSASDDPACLFNRALVHHAQLQLVDMDEAQLCRLARRNYTAYVDTSPYEAAAERAQKALIELNQICGPLKISAAAVASFDPEVIPPWSGDPPLAGASQPAPRPVENLPPPVAATNGVRLKRRATTWILVGAGAATALGAVMTGIHTRRAYDDLKAREVPRAELDALGIPRTREVPVYAFRETESLERRLLQYEVLTWGLGATAALLLGVGIGRAVLDAEPAPSLSISLSPGFGGLGYGGQF